jgi:hypothetical protein
LNGIGTAQAQGIVGGGMTYPTTGNTPVTSVAAPRRSEARAAGADAVLPKPFELDRLVGVVDAYCPHAPR